MLLYDNIHACQVQSMKSENSGFTDCILKNKIQGNHIKKAFPMDFIKYSFLNLIITLARENNILGSRVLLSAYTHAFLSGGAE